MEYEAPKHQSVLLSRVFIKEPQSEKNKEKNT